MGEEILNTVSGIAREMRRRDPFLAFMLVVGGLLVGWYVYQQQVMNERLVQIQVEAAVDSRQKVATIQALVAAQDRTTQIAEAAAGVQARAADNIAQLVRVVSDERTFDIRTRALVLDAMQASKKSAEATTEAVKDLTEHIRTRDSPQ